MARKGKKPRTSRTARIRAATHRRTPTPVTATVTATGGTANGSVSVSVPSGSNVNLVANAPGVGMQFDQWTMSPAGAATLTSARRPSTVLQNVTGNVTATANFVAIPVPPAPPLGAHRYVGFIIAAIALVALVVLFLNAGAGATTIAIAGTPTIAPQNTATQTPTIAQPTATLAATNTPVPPTATVAPTAAPTIAGVKNVVVPNLDWTEWIEGNLVVKDAIEIRPTKPFEATVQVNLDKTYQFKTDYLDYDSKTWLPGERIYKFRIQKGMKPVVLGTQGDTAVKLCLGPETDANLLWMKTRNGNGTSALVRFEPTTQNPEPGKFCP